MLLAFLLLGYVFRDQVGATYRRIRHLPPPPVTEVYQLPDSGDRAEVRRKLDSMSGSRDMPSMDFSAGQIAAIIEAQLRAGRRAIDSVQVAFVEPEVRVRASLDMTQVPRGALGPFAGSLEGRQPVAIAGQFHADSAGRLMLTVTALSVADFPFPRGTIAAVLRALRVPDVAGRSLPVPLDQRIGGVAVRGRTLRLFRYQP
ncbi:MAG: hypothetical protein A2085_08550 [Gemmatimonadetes bacterium GWC2_71_10]|nr:MAG: hypothetical protein A2085_08550 [Gemmatimonadetes bacterium GWC2_71_10]